mmetsp:Transcript_16022/g.37125  ORF Transcript_16022/g.37125 Transcript_16022/m.37125 type:complete len:646 (-) Transcript_16022:270-2207(-)
MGIFKRNMTVRILLGFWKPTISQTSFMTTKLMVVILYPNLLYEILVGPAVVLLQYQHSPSYRICFDGAQFPNHLLEFSLPILTRFFLHVEDLHQTLHWYSAAGQPDLVPDGLECDQALAVFVHLHNCLGIFGLLHNAIGTAVARPVVVVDRRHSRCGKLALGLESSLFGGLHDFSQVVAVRVPAFRLLVIFGQYLVLFFGLPLVPVREFGQLLGCDFSSGLGEHKSESRQGRQPLGTGRAFAVQIIFDVVVIVLVYVAEIRFAHDNVRFPHVNIIIVELFAGVVIQFLVFSFNISLIEVVGHGVAVVSRNLGSTTGRPAIFLAIVLSRRKISESLSPLSKHDVIATTQDSIGINPHVVTVTVEQFLAGLCGAFAATIPISQISHDIVFVTTLVVIQQAFSFHSGFFLSGLQVDVVIVVPARHQLSQQPCSGPMNGCLALEDALLIVHHKPSCVVPLIIYGMFGFAHRQGLDRLRSAEGDRGMGCWQHGNANVVVDSGVRFQQDELRRIVLGHSLVHGRSSVVAVDVAVGPADRLLPFRHHGLQEFDLLLQHPLAFRFLFAPSPPLFGLLRLPSLFRRRTAAISVGRFVIGVVLGFGDVALVQSRPVPGRAAEVGRNDALGKLRDEREGFLGSLRVDGVARKRPRR